MVEIYGLFDPDTGVLRYVGKANNASIRLKNHLRESKEGKRPIHQWVAGLLEQRKLPRLEVLETVPDSQWTEAEIRLIALHRQSSDLLNVADGGEIPFQTLPQRRKCAQTANKANAAASPAMKAFIDAKKAYARLATEHKKRGDITGYWRIRIKMHDWAMKNPRLFGTWLINGW